MIAPELGSSYGQHIYLVILGAGWGVATVARRCDLLLPGMRVVACNLLANSWGVWKLPDFQAYQYQTLLILIFEVETVISIIYLMTEKLIRNHFCLLTYLRRHPQRSPLGLWVIGWMIEVLSLLKIYCSVTSFRDLSCLLIRCLYITEPKIRKYHKM